MRRALQCRPHIRCGVGDRRVGSVGVVDQRLIEERCGVSCQSAGRCAPASRTRHSTTAVLFDVEADDRERITRVLLEEPLVVVAPQVDGLVLGEVVVAAS